MIPAWVEGVAIAVEPYGSRVTCDPPPTDTDEDWLVLVTEFDTLHYALVDTGFARSDRETETLRLLDRLDQGMHRLLSERANDPVVEEAHRDVHDLAALLSDNPEIEYAGAHTGLPCRFYRRGELNVQVTTDREYFRRSMEATRLAKQFNLLNKADRIALFEVVTDQLYHSALPDETVEF